MASKKNIEDVELNTIDRLNMKKSRCISYGNLYAKLDSSYNRDSRLGIVQYEVFTSTDIVKPHFDVETTLKRPDFEKADRLKVNFLLAANEIFSTTDDDWAISEDHRQVEKKVDKEWVTSFKLSFHFILSTKKCLFSDFCKWINNNIGLFKDDEVRSCIDTAIYRRGTNKFRMPMTKKHEEDLNSLLKPLNYKDSDNFHKHLVQITDGCEEYEIEINPNDISYIPDKETLIVDQINKHNKETNDDIQDIIMSYDLISDEPTKHDRYPNCLFYNINSLYCGKEHESNHNYLIHNTLLGTLKNRCHSDNCTGFEKILCTGRSLSMHFSHRIFNDHPVQSGEEDNYNELQRYFEDHFIYIRDSNSFYRYVYKWNRKHKYYDRKMKPINIYGYSKDLFYKVAVVDNNGNETYKLHNFYARYEKDYNKKAFGGLDFNPYGVNENTTNIDAGEYNLFNGFNYTKMLKHREKQITDDDKTRFNFLRTHILKYICGMDRAEKSGDPEKIELAKKSYLFLINFLANIINNPSFVTHIILVFYSAVHGTGKSGFLKFISSIIGTDLTIFASLEQITEKHSNAHVGKLLNVIEESNSETSKRYYSKIKDLSQREDALYNEKNKTVTQINSYVRYAFTTNDQDGVYYTKEDRRITVYTFDKIKDKEYVEQLMDILNDKKIIWMFGKMLEKQGKAWTRKEFENNRPLTEDYYKMMSDLPPDKFLIDLVKLDGICMEGTTEQDYFKASSLNSNIYGEEDFAVSSEILYQKYVDFYEQNHCIGYRWKSKLKFFNYIMQKHSDCFIKRKFKEMQTKKYFFVFNAEKLWNKIVLDEEYERRHNPY